jgi:D-alanyl-D-alanine dipeptidase
VPPRSRSAVAAAAAAAAARCGVLLLVVVSGCAHGDPYAGLSLAEIAARPVPDEPPSPPRPPFRIRTLRTIAEARARAAAASPPVDPAATRAADLVDLAPLDATLAFDLKYATADNFLGAAVYAAPRARLQRPAAEALVRAHRRLAPYGYGLVVFDAYRPWAATKTFWESASDADRAFLGDPATGSRHNRGAAVDVGLRDLRTGAVLAMPSAFDEFTERAAADYPGGTAAERRNRALLRRAMEDEGFAVLPHEWWHFDYRDWASYPVLNEPL